MIRAHRAPGLWRGRTARLLSVSALLLASLLVLAAEGRATVPEAHNCRFWGLIGTGYPETLIRDQLRDGTIANLRDLGGTYPDGWGFAYVMRSPIELPFGRPLQRRGGPPANDPYDPDYDLAVDELALVRPAAALGHVRLATSGHLGIPDPHPFEHDGWIFAHNGGLSVENLAPLLGDYLSTHPPDYVHGLGQTGYIDSELYFLFLLKFIGEHPELSVTDAIAEAVAELAADAGLVGASPELNFVLTDGNTLYALHYYGSGYDNPVRYSPQTARAGEDSPYYVVASEVMGSQAEGWETIPPHTLAVFVPGQPVTFRPVGPVTWRAAPEGGDLPGPSVVRTAPVAPDTSGDHNCRFWALVGTGYPSTMIEDHLQDGVAQNLRELGTVNSDGWGLGYYLPVMSEVPLSGPVVRRGGPSAADPYEYDYGITVNEMRLIWPRAAVAHVRLATSGHTGIPDPHPFQQRGMLFAHNGNVSVSALENRLGNYLVTNPPDYKRGLPGTGHIDSELYFLYVLKLMDAHPELEFTDALLAALNELVVDRQVTGASPALNFALTNGDTLYALSYYGLGSTNLVHYFPLVEREETPSSPFWVVASQPLGNSSNGWGTIPPHTLGVFVPGAEPTFLAVGDPLQPEFSLAAVQAHVVQDQDADGWGSQLEICCDPNASFGTWQVSLVVQASLDGSTWQNILSTRYMSITAMEPDEFCPTMFVTPDTLGPSRWDLKLELWENPGAPRLVTTATAETHPGSHLADVPVEGPARDTIPDIPRSIDITWVDRVSEIDQDEDGYARAFILCWDADLNIPQDSARVYATVQGVENGSVFSLGSTDPFTIRGEQPDTFAFPVTVTPASRPPRTWDLVLQLFDAEVDTLIDVAWPAEYTALAAVQVEGANHDESETPPDTLGPSVDVARPNPCRGEVRFPIHVPQGGAEVAIDIYSIQGRRVWHEGPLVMDVGDRELRWAGRDMKGAPANSGVYFCRVRIGRQAWSRRVLVVR